MLIRRSLVVGSAGMALLGLAACGGSDGNGGDAGAGDEWRPSQPVEFIVPYDAGGGTDIVFRQLIQIINDGELSGVQWVVQNRGGGSGTTGMRYVMELEGDEHTLLGTTPGHISVPLVQSMDISVADLTPIANTLIDPQVLWTSEGSDYTSVESIVDALQAESGSVSIGGAPIAQDDHLTTLLFERAIESETTYVPFSGGGEIKTALLGGQTDLAWLNPNEAAGQTVEEGGTLVPIAVALEDRLDGMPDVPTFTEEGYDVVYDMFFRGITAPPGVSDEVAEYYADVVETATQAEAWQEFIASSQVEAQYMDGETFASALEEWTAEVESLLAEAS